MPGTSAGAAIDNKSGVSHGVINNKEAAPHFGSRFERRTGRTMSSQMPVGAGALLKHRSFVLFLLSRSLSRFSSLIGVVAFGWQVYDLTGSAFALGMMGLVGFLPAALLVFVAGDAPGRFERQRVLPAPPLSAAPAALFF